MKFRQWGWGGLVAGILGLSWVNAMGKKPPLPAPSFNSWLVYWDVAKGGAVFEATADRFEEVALFAYHFAPDNALVPADSKFDRLMQIYQQLPSARKPRLAITIVNDKVDMQDKIQLKDPACVHRALSTPEARQAHIQQIMAIAENTESIDIDYERVAAEDNAAFIEFIQELANALHAKKKRLSVIVEPRISDAPTSDPLANGVTTVSWESLSQAADRLTVMAYLYHYGGSAPGSIAPIDWARAIAAYGLTKVPSEKLCIALHLGGIDWPEKGPGRSLEYEKAKTIARAFGTSIQFDKKTLSGHFIYKEETNKHEVWIETGSGVQEKIEKLRQMGITQFAFWRLGTGDPSFWRDLPKDPKKFASKK